MRNHLLFQFALFLAALFLSQACSTVTAASDDTLHSDICVNSDEGVEQCQHNTAAICYRSLEEANAFLKKHSRDVWVEIETNITLHTVFELVNFSNIHFIGSTGNSSSVVYIECAITHGIESTGAGFSIDSGSNFSFVDLSLLHCSTQTIIGDSPYKFAMLVQASSGFSLRNVRFESCGNTALVLENNRDQVVLHNTSFVENVGYANDPVSNSGALSILQNMSNTYSRVEYMITHSSFERNKSPAANHSNHSDFRYRGYGGAVFIMIGGNTTESIVTIENSTFTHNKAVRGAGVYAFYDQDASKNKVVILNSNFSHNGAISGAGVNIGFENLPSAKNIFVIRDCIFSHNFALYGAGLTVYSVYDNQSVSNSVVVNGSSWYNNSGEVSPAVDIAPIYGRIDLSRGYLPMPEFYSCFFSNNTIHNKYSRNDRMTHRIKTGVFAVTKFKVLIGGHTSFISNNFSAMILTGAVIEFQKDSMTFFIENYGYNGGAIAMYGFSMILFGPPSYTEFRSNQAINNGGAIYYHTNDQRSFLQATDVQCFLRSTVWREKNLTLISSIEVVFNENVAAMGSAIYSESFKNCHNRSSSAGAEDSDGGVYAASDMFSCVGNFTFIGSDSPQLESSGMRFVYADSKCEEMQDKMCTLDNTTAVGGRKLAYFSCKSIPGDKICLPFNVLDEFDNKVKPVLVINKHSGKDQVNVTDPYSLTNKIHTAGSPGGSSNFTVSVLGVRQIYFNFMLSLLPCPPGYHIKQSTNSCACATGKQGYKAILKCDDAQFSAQLREIQWVGYIPENSSNYAELYFAPCKYPLCITRNYTLPKENGHLSESICNENREGIMCGRCKKNYSTHYHSIEFKCGNNTRCSLGLVFFLLTEIVPMFVFFVAVVSFDLSFTTGNAVGFVFFTQYLDHLTIHVDGMQPFGGLRVPYQFFYGLFNFDFSVSSSFAFCLWKDASVLDIIAFKYLTIAIAFGFVLLLAVLMRRCSCTFLCWMRKRVSPKTSLVHGLSAFLVICYVQCTRTSLYILKYSTPVGYKDTHESLYSYYGGLPYFHGRHLLYAIPALMSLVFVTILPPLVLLLYPLSLHLLSLCGLSEHWIVNRTLKLTGINKLMPFIDCFQSCYKDRLRFFAGLHFFYRAMILLVITLSHDALYMGIFSQLLLIVILSIHATLQPYKRKIHNFISILIFFDLALINGCFIISRVLIYELDDPSTYTADRQFIMVAGVQLVLLYLPLVVTLCILSIFFLSQLKSRCYARQGGDVEVDSVLVSSQSERRNILTGRNRISSSSPHHSAPGPPNSTSPNSANSSAEAQRYGSVHVLP